MRLVDFTRDMRPWRKGESRLVPDDVAEKLVADGVAEVRPSVFDNRRDEVAEESRKRRTYRTRGLF